VTSTEEHELDNIKKCLAAGFNEVFLVWLNKRFLAQGRKLALASLSEGEPVT
jgi:hypothetical protein